MIIQRRDWLETERALEGLRERAIDSSTGYSTEQRTVWKRQLGWSDGELFTEETEEAIRGFIAFYNNKGTLIVEALYVDPKFQGQGVGKSLLKTAEIEARGRGIKRIFLRSSLGARRFYESQGFTELPNQEDYRGSTKLESYAMSKSLGGD
jgi:GNAT superfamily N-acetyltransferase